MVTVLFLLRPLRFSRRRRKERDRAKKEETDQGLLILSMPTHFGLSAFSLIQQASWLLQRPSWLLLLPALLLRHFPFITESTIVVCGKRLSMQPVAKPSLLNEHSWSSLLRLQTQKSSSFELRSLRGGWVSKTINMIWAFRSAVHSENRRIGEKLETLIKRSDFPLWATDSVLRISQKKRSVHAPEKNPLSWKNAIVILHDGLIKFLARNPMRLFV